MTRNAGPTILAVASDDERHDAVIREAAERARDAGATLILYDIDAPAGPLAEPLPTNWSGDGQAEMVGNRLGPEDLDAAGRERLGARVRELRSAGVMAYGWLPQNADAGALTEYARDEGVGTVILSSEDEKLREGLDIPVEVVAPSGAAGSR